MKYTILVLCLLVNTLNADQSYRVASGDTLSTIAKRFYNNSRDWPYIAYANPGSQNLLKVGQRLVIPRLTSRMRANPPSPRLVKVFKDDTYINHFMVLDKATLRKIPEIVDIPRHTIASAGNIIFGAGVTAPKNAHLGIYRKEQTFDDPDTRHRLGTQIHLIGKVKVISAGNPATLLVTKAHEEILVKDKLLPLHYHYEVKNKKINDEPQKTIQVIACVDGSVMTSAHHWVVLNEGGDRLTPGDKLIIIRKGTKKSNPLEFGSSLHFPAEKIGALIVGRTYTNVSYAYITNSIIPVRAKDIALTPQMVYRGKYTI